MLFSVGIIGPKVPFVAKRQATIVGFQVFPVRIRDITRITSQTTWLGEKLNFASNPSGFRNNASSIANLDSKYLDNPQREPVFWAQMTIFAQSPL